MPTDYLDKTGLSYFWSKIKAYVAGLLGAKADDADVVHKDGNESIDGIKEFSNSYYDSTHPNESNWESSSLIIRYKNYVKGSGAPSANKYANLLFLDKTGSNIDWEGRMSSVESGVFPNGENHTRLVCYKNQIISETEPRNSISITVGYDPNGIRFAAAPSTSEDRTENTDILTRDWIPKDTRIVHTTGNETIAGTKTFSSTITGSISGNAATATKLATARTINGVSFDGSANITVADSTKLPLAGGTVTGNITMSASKSIVFDLSATTPTASTPRSLPIQFKSKSIDNDYVFTNFPFFEIPLTQDANYGMGVGFGAGGLTLIGAGEAGRAIVSAESLVGGSENVVIVADSTVDFYTNCNTIANRVKTSIDTSGNFTGKASNVTGTVAIANGGTGATTRLNAVKALTNESVGTAATFFLTITNSWGKAGYTSVADAKTVLGLKSAAYTESSDYVHMSGNETVGGAKIFSSGIGIVNSSPSLTLKDTNGVKGSTDGWCLGEWFNDKDNKYLGYISVGRYGGNTDLHNALTFRTYTTATASDTTYFEVRVICYTTTNNDYMFAFEPDASSRVLLGRSSRKWKEIWCDQSSINSSSDERLKDDVEPVPDAVLDAWLDVDWVQYRFKAAKSEKGADARFHTGAVAQRIDEAFRAAGLDVSRYGLFLHDSWDAVPDVFDENGVQTQKAQSAGDEYGLRYVEALCMEAACMRRENARLKRRIADLEDRLAALELKIS